MKRLILSISLLLVLGLAAAAIAYTTNNNVTGNEVAVSSCCCKGDSCPMKKNAAGEHVSCCDEDCCKDGKCSMHSKDGAMNHDSCPMKGKDGASHEGMTAEQHQAMMAEGKSCCCPCCKKKDAA